MIRHVVCFRWTTGTDQATIDAIAEGLGTMPPAIDAIRSYRYGQDLGLVDGNWDFTVTADFDDIEGYVTYRDHPAHQALIAERIAPHLEQRVAVQFEHAG